MTAALVANSLLLVVLMAAAITAIGAARLIPHHVAARLLDLAGVVLGAVVLVDAIILLVGA